MPYLLCGFGFFLAAVAHLGAHEAGRRAREYYQEIMGNHQSGLDTADNLWHGVRHDVGWWGCLKIVLEIARGAGILLMIAALLYELIA